MERIGDLLLERTRPRGPGKPVPLLFIHGMWLGSWCWENYLEAAGHGHMLMLEEGWERPFKEILSWIERAIAEEPRR